MLTALLALALACQDAPPIAGLVVEVGGPGMPVAGLMVALSCGDGIVRFAPTDANGRVEFGDLPPSLTYTASIAGSQTRSAMCTQLEYVGKRGVRPVLGLTLEPGCPLRVLVVDADGAPVPGANVESNGGVQLARVWSPLGKTGADGTFVMPAHAPRGQLRAWARGRQPSTFTTVQAREGEPIDLRLQLGGKGAVLQGRVLAVDGRPLPRASIAVAQFGADAIIPEFIEADDAGAFTLDWLIPGHVALVARPADPSATPRAYARLDVTASDNPALDLRMAKGARLEGVLRRKAGPAIMSPDLVGRFLPDAVFDLPYLEFQRRVGADGSFALDGLTPGTWKVTARFHGVEVEQRVVLREGETTTLEIDEPATAVLRLALRDPRGQPLAGWRVERRNEHGFPEGGSSQTDADGEVPFADLAWRLRVDRPVTVALYAPLEGGGHGMDCDWFPTSIVPGLLPDDRPQEIVVPDHARPVHRLRGRARRIDGQPITEGTVEVSTARARGFTARFDLGRDGTFAAGPFSPGHYDLTVTVPGLGSVGAEDVKLEAGADAVLPDLVFGAAMPVAVVLDGEAPADLVLALFADGGGRRVRLGRSEDGTFRATRVPPGSHWLRGASASAFVVPQRIRVGAEAVTVNAACRPAPTLRVAVDLPVDGDRSQSGWSGTLVVRDASGNVLVQRSLDHRFRGVWRADLGFAVAVPAGACHVQLQTWDRQTLHTELEITPAGATATFAPK